MNAQVWHSHIHIVNAWKSQNRIYWAGLSRQYRSQKGLFDWYDFMAAVSVLSEEHHAQFFKHKDAIPQLTAGTLHVSTN